MSASASILSSVFDVHHADPALSATLIEKKSLPREKVTHLGTQKEVRKRLFSQPFFWQRVGHKLDKGLILVYNGGGDNDGGG